MIFHCDDIISPCFSCEQSVFAHGWWTKDGEKMSKSLGNIVDPRSLIDTYGKDYLRYYLCSEIVFGNDGNFNLYDFVDKINSDLANDVGNLVQRVLSMVNNYCGGIVPAPGTVLTADDRILLYKSIVALLHSRGHVRGLRIKQYCDEVLSVSQACNKYMDSEAPWKSRNTNVSRFMTVMFVLCNCIRRLAILLDPVIPDYSKQMLDQLNIPAHLRTFKSMGSREVNGLRILPPTPIFPKLLFPCTDPDAATTKPAEAKCVPCKNKDKIPLPTPLCDAAGLLLPAEPVPAVIKAAEETPEERTLRMEKIAETEEEIAQVGSKLRALKASGTLKEELKPHINKLLVLKDLLKKLRSDK
jgi:hypothetical protein